uniref:Uncharacterized protein n=1 Tax=Anguilla anguilla TaxID=7936 RepID=A0A0E9UKI6_ANGAN
MQELNQTDIASKILFVTSITINCINGTGNKQYCDVIG